MRNNLRGEVKVPARKKVFKGSRVKSSIWSLIIQPQLDSDDSFQQSCVSLFWLRNIVTIPQSQKNASQFYRKLLQIRKSALDRVSIEGWKARWQVPGGKWFLKVGNSAFLRQIIQKQQFTKVVCYFQQLCRQHNCQEKSRVFWQARFFNNSVKFSIASFLDLNLTEPTKSQFFIWNGH